MHGSREDVAEKVREMLERIRSLEKENRALKDKLALGQGTDLASAAVELDGIKVLATRVDGADAGALRAAVDQLKSRLRSAVIVLGAVQDTAKVMLVAGVTADRSGARQSGGTYRRRWRPKWVARAAVAPTLLRPEAIGPRRSMRHWPASCPGSGASSVTLTSILT